MNWKCKQTSADSSVSPVTLVLNKYINCEIYKHFFPNTKYYLICNGFWGAILFVEKVFVYWRPWWQSASYLLVIGSSRTYGPKYFLGWHQWRICVDIIREATSHTNMTQTFLLLDTLHYKWNDYEIDTTRHNWQDYYPPTPLTSKSEDTSVSPQTLRISVFIEWNSCEHQYINNQITDELFEHLYICIVQLKKYECILIDNKCYKCLQTIFVQQFCLRKLKLHMSIISQ